MSLREHFAAMAMQGLASKYEFYLGKESTSESLRNWTKRSVCMADALLAELEKGEK